MIVVTSIQTAAPHEDESGRIDLQDLCSSLSGQVFPPPSYLAGKTAIRDAVIDRLDCSAALAERMVDRMESMGFIRFERRRQGPLVESRWRIGDSEAMAPRANPFSR